MPDTSSWPTKAEVCETLGIGLSQVNNLIKARRLEVRQQRRLGAPPIGKVNPEDVAREKQLREAQATKAHVMPDDSSSVAVAPLQPAAGAIERLAAMLPPPPIQPRPFMSLQEAAAYTGLGAGWISTHVEGLKGRGPHGATVYRRADLDKL
jgi:hypothetical protein